MTRLLARLRASLRRKPDPVADGLLAVFNSRQKLEAEVDMALRKVLRKEPLK